jgi:hypothetical protein
VSRDKHNWNSARLDPRIKFIIYALQAPGSRPTLLGSPVANSRIPSPNATLSIDHMRQLIGRRLHQFRSRTLPQVSNCGTPLKSFGGAAIPSAVGGCCRPVPNEFLRAGFTGAACSGRASSLSCPDFRPSLHAGLCGMYLSRATTSTRVSATTKIHRDNPRSRCRPTCHDTPVPRTTPTTSRPRKRSRIARHGTSVKCSSRWMTANLPLASRIERR